MFSLTARLEVVSFESKLKLKKEALRGKRLVLEGKKLELIKMLHKMGTQWS